jgi:purine-binding chemotaxis protein CheW
MAIDEKQYITFKLEEDYGIELTRIKEIIRHQELTVIPEAPSFILGILSLRGIAVPVIDLRKLFNLPDKQINEYSVIIVMEVLGRLMGMLVDGVLRYD